MAPRVLSFIILVAASACCRAAIFGSDDRIRVAATENSPLAAVGRITSRHQAGSGFLVSECHVLSAKHILSDRKSVIGREVKFKVALRSGEVVSSHGAVIADGGFDIADQEGNPAVDRRRDWILIRLDNCLGRRLGYLELAEHDVPNVDETIRSAGYPQRSLGQLVIDPSCRVHFQTGSEWRHDCAVLPGNSGGPIFRHILVAGQERVRVLGMHTSAHHWFTPRPFDPRDANAATKSSFLAEAIRPYLK